MQTQLPPLPRGLTVTHTEVWLPVPEWEWAYLVSDSGLVRSCDRISQTRAGYNRMVKGRVLRPKLSSGYLAVTLSLDGSSITRRIHRLVAAAFHGPCPPGMQVCHNNGDRMDNRAINLRYGTPKENGQDSSLHGALSQQKKIECKWGHRLVPPNLVVAHWEARRVRQCRACNISNARRQRRSDLDHQAESDAVYEMIMKGIV